MITLRRRILRLLSSLSRAAWLGCGAWLACGAWLGCAAVMVLGGPAAAQVNAKANAQASAQAGAQVKGSPTPAPKSQPDTMATILANSMVFYLAQGEPDACGPGCGEWIAAEGSIDFGAAQRFRAFLARLGKRKLPIFFSSPGGLGGPAMEIGRILRAREMTAGVSKTNPAGCVAASDQSCRALKRSGQVLAAELDNLASCNSGCVYALVGAKVRQVPPGARLGVHSAKLVQVYRDGRVKAALQGDPSAHEKSLAADAQFRRYLQEMRIDAGLFGVTSKVPYEQVHYLSRDEIAAFGIDTREFLEARWMAVESPSQGPSRGPSVVKFMVEVKGASRKEFRTSMIKLNCAVPRRVSIAYVRGLGSDETGTTRSIRFTIDDRAFALPQKTFISKIDAMDAGGSFDTRIMYEPLEFFEAAATHDSIDIVETDPTDKARPPRTTKLSTHGLSRALEGLEKNCGQQPAFPGTPGVGLPETPGVKYLDVPGLGARR
jgi:hypothetical protein